MNFNVNSWPIYGINDKLFFFQLGDRDNQIVDMRSKVQGLEHTVELKNSHIKENEDLLSVLNGDLRHSQNELSASRIKVAELGSHIEELKDKLTEVTQSVSLFTSPKHCQKIIFMQN